MKSLENLKYKFDSSENLIGWTQSTILQSAEPANDADLCGAAPSVPHDSLTESKSALRLCEMRVRSASVAFRCLRLRDLHLTACDHCAAGAACSLF